MSDVNVVETSDGATEKSVVPPCEACKRDVKSEFRCEDCEQFLCSSCRTTHDSLNSCKDHTVVNAEDFVATVGEDKFVQTELTRYQHHLDYLQTMITNMSSEEANDRIDKQVDEICSRAKKLGNQMREKNEKLRKEEEENMRKLVKNSEKSVKDLKARKASIKQKGRKAEVEKVKFDIPDVNYPLFEKGKINETQLSKQLGELMMKGPTLTTSFNFDDEDLQSGKLYKGDKYNIGGLSLKEHEYNIDGLLYSVAVKKDTTKGRRNSLYIYLNLTSQVESSDVEYSVKLINHKDIRESVEKHSSKATSAGDGKGGCWGQFIYWKKFSDEQNGFLTKDNKFTVQATVKVLKIER